ncbi:helix-turn-helix domain-containing protein [Kitasatospora sp. NPDC056181]|uniref:helix-turn-helix domain-containing protein n=1 Tax=Kitasatospora sp. NPDC056181 TaxID=3345737 RepID=UPI0035D96B25
MLRSERRRAALSQEELADRSGVTARAISNLERCCCRPRGQTVRRLVEALELPESEAAALHRAARGVEASGGPAAGLDPGPEPGLPSWGEPEAGQEVVQGVEPPAEPGVSAESESEPEPEPESEPESPGEPALRPLTEAELNRLLAGLALLDPAATAGSAGPVGFGRLLRLQRRRAGLSQEELAGRSGLTARAISNLERHRSRPRGQTVRRLVEALQLQGAEASALHAAASAASGAEAAATAATPAPLPVRPPGRPGLSWAGPPTRQPPPYADPTLPDVAAALRRLRVGLGRRSTPGTGAGVPTGPVGLEPGALEMPADALAGLRPALRLATTVMLARPELYRDTISECLNLLYGLTEATP